MGRYCEECGTKKDAVHDDCHNCMRLNENLILCRLPSGKYAGEDIDTVNAMYLLTLFKHQKEELRLNNPSIYDYIVINMRMLKQEASLES